MREAIGHLGCALDHLDGAEQCLSPLHLSPTIAGIRTLIAVAQMIVRRAQDEVRIKEEKRCES